MLHAGPDATFFCYPINNSDVGTHSKRWRIFQFANKFAKTLQAGKDGSTRALFLDVADALTFRRGALAKCQAAGVLSFLGRSNLAERLLSARVILSLSHSGRSAGNARSTPAV